MIRFEMQDGNTIDIELCKEDAPITAANFEKLAKEGFLTEHIFTELYRDL